MGRRFDTLDGLRGIAALAIVVRHAPGLFGGNLFQTSYLAVDFFFLPSRSDHIHWWRHSSRFNSFSI